MKYHIISIGISNHKNSDYNLSFASKDAKNFHSIILHSFDNIGYNRLLIDSEANMSEIRSVFGNELKHQVNNEDTLFFFFSGHGTIAEDLDDFDSLIHYLVPFDVTDDFSHSCISVSYLKNCFNNLPIKNIIIFIDSCFSGSFTKNSKLLLNPSKKSLTKIKTISKEISGKGKIIIAVSKQEEESIEDPELENGLFTYFLLQQLKNKDKQFPLIELYSPIEEAVKKRASEKYGHIQTPTLYGEIEENIILPPIKELTTIDTENISLPTYSEIRERNYEIPLLNIDDKSKEIIINDFINFTTSCSDKKNEKLNNLIYEKYCFKEFEKIKIKWEELFNSKKDDISIIGEIIIEMEKISIPFIILGCVTSVLGNEMLIDIYFNYLLEVDRLKEGKSGLVAKIKIPEVIVLETLYSIGILSVSHNNLKPLNIFFSKKILKLDYLYEETFSIYNLNELHYNASLSGYADRVCDYIRKILETFYWIPELSPKTKNNIIKYQVQTNFIFCLVMLNNKKRIWPYFGKFESNLIKDFIFKVNNDKELKKDFCNLLKIDLSQLNDKFKELIKAAQENFGNSYYWQSIQMNYLDDLNK
jgi:hypothetical protein